MYGLTGSVETEFGRSLWPSPEQAHWVWSLLLRPGCRVLHQAPRRSGASRWFQP